MKKEQGMAIENIINARADINEVIAKIREVSHKENIFTVGKTEETGKFSDVFSMVKGEVANLNQLQSNAAEIKSAYVAGNSNVSLSQVIVASEKSKLAFEGLLVVRNKFLEAYKEIMNMPV